MASVAVISLKFWIGANAWDGHNQLHRLAAAEARDWVLGLVFGLFSGSHAAKSKTKVYSPSIRMRVPSANANSNTPRHDKKGPTHMNEILPPGLRGESRESDGRAA